MDTGDTLAPGTMIDGEYRIDGPLGRGGMGVVYRARDVRLDRPVAVKLHRGKGLAPERLAREATALARLSHPNVVNVYRVGTHDNRVYVAMELVEGGTLRQSGPTRKPWREIVRLHAAAGDGLAAAHAAGLVHRDYKPDNVLLGADGRPRVADFGLARATGESSGGAIDAGTLATAETVDDAETAVPTPGTYLTGATDTPRTPRLDERLTMTGAWVGTPAYMAPEQADGGVADARTDQFAFAISLWEALHGVRPFAGDTTLVLRAAIRKQELVGADRGDVPRWIDDIMRRALRENPDERWPSMDALLAALRHDPARRRRQLGVAAGAVVLAGGAAMIAWQAKSNAPSGARCDSGAAEIAATWSAEKATALRTRFLETHLPYAPAIADRAIAALDAYAAAWAANHRTACTARANRTWSAELADRAVMCLSTQQRALGETAAVLVGLAGTQIDDAIGIIDGLPPVEACAGPARLRGQELPPKDAEQARLHDELVTLIARATALTDAFDPKSKELADQAIALAKRVDMPKLAAEALGVRAEAAFVVGDPDIQALYEEAFFAARAAGDEESANASALRLVNVALREGRLDAARTWLRHGEAGVSANTTAIAQANVELMRAMIRASDGQLDDAMKDLESARRRLEAIPEGQRYLSSLIELESSIAGEIGDLSRAAALGRESVKLAEARFGPEHPMLATRLTNLALTLSDMGENDEAVATMTRAVAVCRGAPMCRTELGVNLLNLGVVQVNAGRYDVGLATLADADRVLEELGDNALADRALVASARGRAFEEIDQLDEAEASLREALAMSEKANGPEHYDVAAVLNNLGGFLNGSRRYAEAMPYLARAIAVWEKISPGAPQAGLPMVALGRAQLGVGQAKLAVTTLRAAIQRLEAGGFIDRLTLARLRFAQALWAAGERNEAITVTRALSTDKVDAKLADEIKQWQSTVAKNP